MMAVVVAIVLAGCASDKQESGGDHSTSPGQTTNPTVPDGQGTTTIPERSTGGSGGVEPPEDSQLVGWPEADAMLDTALEDLAARLKVETVAIDIVRVEAVTWSSGAIGCPEQGMSYTQALVDGLRIELTSDGTSYWYHQGGSQPIQYCEDPHEPVDGSQQDVDVSEFPGGSKFIPPTTTP